MSTQLTCPTCGGPVDEYHEGHSTILRSAFVETEQNMMALGRLQTTADSLGWTVEVVPITTSNKLFIVTDESKLQKGSGPTRFEALSRAFGSARTMRKPSKI